MNSFFNGIKNKVLGFIKGGIEKKYPEIAQNYAQPTIMPTRTPPEPINITIPGKDGSPYRIPNKANNPTKRVAAEDLMDVFDPYKLATESAKVLLHPRKQTYNPEEVKRLGTENWNYGENPELGTGMGVGEEPTMAAPNPNGSIDYATFRNNDATINDMFTQPYWKGALNRRGISSLEDIKSNSQNSMKAALLTLLRDNYDVYRAEMERQGTNYPDLSGKLNWKSWYAADPELRNR